jgi:disulfide bond formation protein DsbB
VSVIIVARFLALGSFVAVGAALWLVLDRRAAGLIGERVLGLGAGMAALAMAGSLYLSEIVGFAPCELCWYQRIAMYPLVVVLGIGAWRRDLAVWRTGAVLAGVGVAISAWHYLLQWVPSLAGETCDPAVPCNVAWFRIFGFASIPYLAGIAFLFILATLVVARRLERADGPPASSTQPRP